MITTTISVILIIWGAIIDNDYCKFEHRIPDINFKNYVLAIGTFIFSYGLFVFL